MALIHLCRFHRTYVTNFLSRELAVLNAIHGVFRHDKTLNLPSVEGNRHLHALIRRCDVTFTSNSRNFWEKEEEREEKRIVLKEYEFHRYETRNKTTFLAIVEHFRANDRQRRGHVEFVTAAVRSMKDYGVERDLECYKKLLDVFPKNKMIPHNYFVADMMHFPRHQFCVLDMLDEMEYYGICPDKEFCKIMNSIFGPYNHAARKLARMMYWMPKFKNLSPFPLPDPLPHDARELAILAIKRISAVDLQSQIQIFETEELEDSLDKTWIISAQSSKQKELLVEHDKEQPLYVYGPFVVWLKRVSISYFILQADAKIFPEIEEDKDDVSNLVKNLLNPLEPKNSLIKRPSVHEQDDGVITALCATGTSSRDSALSWIRFLQKENPALNDVNVLFTLRAPSEDLVTLNDTRKPNEDVTEGQQPEPPS